MVRTGVLAFAIMAAAGDHLRAWLRPGLAAAGYRFDDDGAVRTDAGAALGATWAIGGAELTARPWFQPRSPCPFLGPCAGHVVIDTGPAPVPRGLVRALAGQGRGVVARLDDDRAVDPVALTAVTVEDAVAVAGLDAGARLLDRDPTSAYAVDVLARLRTAVAAGGMRIGLTWQPLAGRPVRNPIELQRVQPFGTDQLYPPVWAKDGATIDRFHPLRGLTAPLWLLDLDALDALDPLAALDGLAALDADGFRAPRP